MNKHTKIGVGLVVAIALVPLFFMTTRDGIPKPASPNASITVSVVTPRTDTWDATILSNGGVFARQEASVSTDIGGIAIRSLLVDVGSQVKQGQILAHLDNRQAQVDLLRSQADVQKSQTALDEASANAQRARGIADSGAMSQQQIQQYILAEKSAIAGLAVAQAGLAQSRLHLAQTVVKAPVSGVVTERKAVVGAVVQPGTELFRLVKDNRLEWRAEVTDSDANRLSTGLTANIALEDGGTLLGRIRQISPSMDSKSRKGIVYVDLDDSDKVRAGMFVSGKLVLGRTAVLAVPNDSVILRDGHSYVFSVNKDGRVSQIKVKTGRRTAEEVEIIEGVSAGSPLVAVGGGFLNDGDLVEVKKQ